MLLYQGTRRISSKEVIIAVIYKQYPDVVTISDLQINISSTTDNILMSFINGTNAYNNSHGIPYIANNMPPVIKAYDSCNDLIAVIPLHPYMDGNATEVYNTTTVTIINNRFIVPIPTPQSGEVCSIEEIYLNTTSHEFSYFLSKDTNELLITLITSQNLDGE